MMSGVFLIPDPYERILFPAFHGRDFTCMYLGDGGLVVAVAPPCNWALAAGRMVVYGMGVLHSATFPFGTADML